MFPPPWSTDCSVLLLVGNASNMLHFLARVVIYADGVGAESADSVGVESADGVGRLKQTLVERFHVLCRRSISSLRCKTS